MKIFEKRPLALILCIMLGGFSFFADFTLQTKLILAAVPLVIIANFYIFSKLEFGRKPIVIISLLAFSVSLILSSIWSFAFYPSEFYGSNVKIKARIYDIDNSDSSTSVMICKTQEIDGERDTHTFVAYVSKEMAVYVRQYDIVEFYADINEFSDYDDGFDGRSYYVSEGYSALLNNLSDLEVIDNDVDQIDRFFDELQLKISNKLKLRTNFETGAFLSALIVGDRSDLNGNTRLNFARLGISHILALSGMHLAILSLAVNSLLIKLRVKKKLRVTLMSLLVMFYMALTGFSASVLRSGLMLIISGILYLLARKYDAITSLFLSVSLIVLFNPTAIYDLSLWLSAFATMGVIAFSEIAETPDKSVSKIKRFLATVKNGCLISVFAFCATFALTATRFNNFSVASVFTTLIFSFVIPLFIYGGLLLIILGGIIPFGDILVAFSDAMLWVAEKISSIKLVYVSINSFAVRLLLVILTIFFFSFLVLEIKNKRRGVMIIIGLVVSVCVAGEVDTMIHRYDDGVTYVPSTAGDVLLLKDDGDVSVIYSGKAFSDSAWEIADYFYEDHLTYVDNLVFASYSHSTMDFAEAIINSIKVEKIYLPRPETDDELDQAEGISYLLSEYGTKLEFYNLVEYVELGGYRYRLFDKTAYRYGEYPSNVFEIANDDARITYVSTCKYSNLSASAKALIYNSENLLIGTIGNSNYYIFDMKLPKLKNIYYYDDGRLTDEATDFYKEKGASMQCTKTPVSIFD